MDLLSPKAIKFLCDKYNILPQKRLGQNFLISQNVLDKIIQTAELKKDDIILEIGPGLGMLTVELARRVRRVIAVEKDKKMVGALKEILRDFKNIKIIEGDILKISNSQSPIGVEDKFLISNKISNPKPKTQNLKPKTYKIVANLPYQITSAVLRKFLTEEPRPQEMVLMLQKEVGEKICAKPGEMNFLSIFVQFYAKSKIIVYVSKNNFWPKPKVDSVITRICTNLPQISQIDEREFFKIVKAGFSCKRRQLKNNLESIFKKKDISSVLEKIGLDPKIRAEELSVDNWIRLVRILQN